MADVTPDAVEPRKPTLIPDGLHRLRYASRPQPCEARGLSGRVTLSPQIVLEHRQVGAQLVLEVGVVAPTPNRSPYPAASIRGSWPRPPPQLSRSSACMIDTMRSHCAHSVASWRRPAGVMA